MSTDTTDIDRLIKLADSLATYLAYAPKERFTADYGQGGVIEDLFYRVSAHVAEQLIPEKKV